MLLNILTWLLAMTFLVSGYRKYQAPGLATTAVRNFLNATWPPPQSGVLLALAELALGAGLIASAVSYGRVDLIVMATAAGILWIFTMGLLINWIGGRRFECGCFGGAGRGVFGPLTLVRTGVLAVSATALASVTPTASVDVLIEGLAAALIAVTVVASLVAVGAARGWRDGLADRGPVRHGSGEVADYQERETPISAEAIARDSI